MNETFQSLFSRGATWVRADFHLHTDADNEFKYDGLENDYVGQYVSGLREADITVGAITNHNKFDAQEFEALKKSANKNGILLMPGVELSVNDGANGVHTLIVFSDEWLENGNDYITPFITTMFPGKTEAEYGNENARSPKNLLEVVTQLESIHKDYFLVFAHVERKSGLWKEMGGGKLADFTSKNYHTIRNRTLGFQLVETHDAASAGRKGDIGRIQAQNHFGDWFPAEVEGSDCKSIEQIGKTQANKRKCFLKIGEPSFQSVKFALRDHKQRVLNEEPPKAPIYPRIHEISFVGGKLDDQSYSFSDNLVSLIGSRGSGKSSVLECLRYGLGLEAGEDAKYKNGLVSAMLANGGEVRINGLTHQNQSFEITRSLGYNPTVRLEGTDTQLRPSDILPGLLYFGQKDLGRREDHFEDDLFSKLVPSPTIEELAMEEELITKVRASVEEYQAVLQASEKEKEYAQEEARLKQQLEIYKNRGVETQLERLTTFDADKRNLQEFIKQLKQLKNGLNTDTEDWNDIVADWPILKSPILSSFLEILLKQKNEFSEIKSDYDKLLARLDHLLSGLEETWQKILEKERELQEEFAALQREVNAPDLDLSKFRQEKSRHAQLEKLLKAAGDRKSMASQSLDRVTSCTTQLHAHWRKSHREEQQAIENRNETLPESLTLNLTHEGRRTDFDEFLKSKLSGTGFRATSRETLVETFRSGFALFQQRENLEDLLGGTADVQKCHNFIEEHLAELLTFRIRDMRTISYQGTSISELSLGQRATALLQLLMSLRDHSILILDQPEDDLDNETIFRQVVEPLLKRKAESQFIIATHNPNIPVLGDAELVHACHEHEKNKYSHTPGSLDSKSTRNSIVTIMEGGEDAFKKRQEVYTEWTNLPSEKNS